MLDVAKLVAAFIDSDQKAEDCFGTGFIKKKGLWLACLPTTAGTGSEVSPNAILLDERDKLKKGIVSPYLLADAAYVDPKLTMTVPAKVTADTGMDALTHCIEAYTNKFAHPAADIYALQGIKLIAANLLRAVKDGSDVEAREALALGSLYGGLVLGPVNTAAVHALSYPLGGEFHIPHGLSNAILLPSVMKFNRPANLSKYAEVAIACGAPRARMTTRPPRTASTSSASSPRLSASPRNFPTSTSPRAPSTAWPRQPWRCSVCSRTIPARSPNRTQRTSTTHSIDSMKPILAITMGDPAGIGPEIVVRALSHKETYEKCRPIVTGDAAVMKEAVKLSASTSKSTPSTRSATQSLNTAPSTSMTSTVST